MAADVAATVAVVAAVNAGKLSLEFVERERVSAPAPFFVWKLSLNMGEKGLSSFLLGTYLVRPRPGAQHFHKLWLYASPSA